MSFGKANHILNKSILYNLASQLNELNCFHCGKFVDIKTFSIEHKIPWLHSSNPRDLFFNRSNITFSHLSCNVSSRRKEVNGLPNDRDRQLGEKYGTANNKLKRALVFCLLNELDKINCFVCNEVLCENSYSIEHKNHWLDSEEPIKNFFDLNNISFSHKKCNFGNARKTLKIDIPDGQGWCWCCKSMKLLNEFSAAKMYLKGFNCRSCSTESRKKYKRNR